MHSRSEKVEEMKPRKTAALFTGIILASTTILYLKLYHQHWMLSSSLTFSQILTPLDLRQGKINVSTLLDSISPSFPAMLIDTSLLIALYKGDRTWKRKIKLALDIKYINQISGSELRTYEIFYYDNQTNKNYIQIYDNQTRILPRIPFENRGNVLIPVDIVLFLQYWKRSIFINCLNLDMSRNETEPPILPREETVQAMSSLMLLFVSFSIFPFLAGGSLLGWYRECNIIPHTMDVDFAAPINEYKPALLEHLKSNQSELFVRRKLGTLNDSLEFTLLPTGKDAPMMDVFWLYTIANESWVAGLASDATKYKYIYPRISKICAGDLLGHIFWVPCNTQAVVEKEYGPEWKRDHSTTNFSWYSSHFNVMENGRWTLNEMEEVYHSY